MAQILCNHSYSINNAGSDATELLEKAITEDRLESLILIVPTGKLVRRYKEDIIRKYFKEHEKPVHKLNIYTLQTFINYCFWKIPEFRKYRLVSDAYRLALFEEAAAQANLKFFTHNDKQLSSSILDRLENIIYGLKEDGIEVANLKADIESAGTDIALDYDLPRLSDIASLYQSYQKILSNKFLDQPEMLNLINQYFPDEDKANSNKSNNAHLNKNIEGNILELFNEENINPAPKLSNMNEINGKITKINHKIDELFEPKQLILMLGFSEFKLPEVKFISKFSTSAVPLNIRIDYSIENGPLFGTLEDAIISLQNSGFHLFQNPPSAAKINTDIVQINPSAYIRRWLFNTEKEIQNPELSKMIKIIAADSRTGEIKAIAKLIKYLVKHRAIPLNEMCICLPNPDTYSNLFREIFTQYKIPANITDRFSLANSPVIGAVFAVLDIITRGFNSNDINRALQSKYLTFQPDEDRTGSSSIDSANIFEVANKWRIVG